MEFINPTIAMGTTLAAIPIIIHLINRRRFKRISWAAMEFLLRAHKKIRKRLRIENLLLLIIRVLVLSLLALALARPLFRHVPFGLAGESEKHVVIVIDNSFSMDYRHGYQTPLALAKIRAHAVMDTIVKSGDEVSLILMNDYPTPIIFEPTVQFANVRSAIDSIKVSCLGTDVPATFEIVAEALKKSHKPNKVVYIITDCQKNAWLTTGQAITGDHQQASAPSTRPTSWATSGSSSIGQSGTSWGIDPELAELLRTMGEIASVNIVDVGPEAPQNLTVTDFFTTAQVIGVFRSTPLFAEVTNFSDTDRTACELTLYVDGRVQETTTFSVPAYGKATVTFHHQFLDPGPHYATVSLGHDYLPVDNARHLALSVRQEIRVLCVDGEPDPEKWHGETDFLAAALNPSPMVRGRPYIINVDVVRLMELREKNLSDYDVLVLANVERIPEEEVSRVTRFLNGGGGLLIFLGDRVAPDFYNRQLYRSGEGFLPCTLKEILGSDTTAVTFTENRYDHPALAFFHHGRESMLEVDLKVFRYYAVDVDADAEGVRVLSRFNDHDMTPAIIEKRFGKGKVIVFTTSCDIEWNIMPATITYLPLIHETVLYLSERFLRLNNIIVGSTFEMEIEPKLMAPTFFIEFPDRKTRSSQSPITTEDERYLLIFKDAFDAGIYRVFRQPRTESEQFLSYFAANVPPHEGNLARMEVSDFDLYFKDIIKFNVSREVEQVRREEDAKPPVTEVWKYFIYAVLLLLVSETVLAQLFGRYE